MEEIKLNKEVVVVPDVHGRLFWKDVMDYDCEIVFLGDYLDPYVGYEEGVSTTGAIENFKEILEFAKSRDNVTLLYGNHDCGYAIDRNICSCRMDQINYNLIKEIFEENAGMFKFAHEVEISGTRFIFTHSAIMREWWMKHDELFGDSVVSADAINGAFSEKRDLFVKSLMDISHYRGGHERVGSMIWSDLTETVANSISYPGSEMNYAKEFVNIFGHSLVGVKNEDEPLAILNRYCLDCKQNFYIDSDANVRFLKNDEIVKVWQLGTTRI